MRPNRTCHSGHCRTVAAAVGGSTLTDGLVAWWELDEASGTRADSHTNGIDLTDVNTVGSVSDATFGTVADFTSADADQLTAVNSALEATAGGNTLVAWVRRDARRSYPGIAVYDNVGQTTDKPALAFYFFNDRLYARVRSTTASLDAGPSSALTLGAPWPWYFIVAQYDPSQSGAEIRLILDNGTPVTAAFTGTRVAGGAISVSRFFGTSHDGQMCKVAYWTRALSSDEITELYNSGSGIGYPG